MSEPEKRNKTREILTVVSIFAVAVTALAFLSMSDNESAPTTDETIDAELFEADLRYRLQSHYELGESTLIEGMKEYDEEQTLTLDGAVAFENAELTNQFKLHVISIVEDELPTATNIRFNDTAKTVNYQLIFYSSDYGVEINE